MRYHSIAVWVFAFLGVTGCLGRLTSSEPPRYFEVDYAYLPSECLSSFGDGVRIWMFSATAPFDRDEMIVLDRSRRVQFSPHYRWVALPGVMLSDRLLEDLSHTHIFPRALGAGAAYTPTLHLGGHIFQFAWEELGSTARAVLDLEVSLWSEEPKIDILFRKHYHLESEPVVSGSSEKFAEHMSKLVQQMSFQLRQDLCIMPKGSSSQDDG